MKTKDLIVLDRHYDRQADAWLLLGQRCQNGVSLPSFTVAWSPRLAPDNLYQPKSHLDEASARRRFTQIIEADGHPSAKVFSTDFQQETFYNWEIISLDPYDRQIQDPASANSLIRTIALDYNIPKPPVVWRRTGRSNFNHGDSYELDLANLSLLEILHEMAHAIHLNAQNDCDIDQDASPHHGPAFTWIAVELYHRYAGFDLGYLIETANQENLLGPMLKSQNLFPKRSVFTFPVPVCEPKPG